MHAAAGHAVDLNNATLWIGDRQGGTPGDGHIDRLAMAMPGVERWGRVAVVPLNVHTREGWDGRGVSKAVDHHPAAGQRRFYSIYSTRIDHYLARLTRNCRKRQTHRKC